MLALTVNSAMLGSVFLDRGDLKQAAPIIERAIELARRGIGGPPGLGPGPARGRSHLAGGLPARYRSSNSAAVGVDGFPVTNTIHMTWLAEAYLAADQVTNARQTIQEALARAVLRQEHAVRAMAIHVLGKIAASGEAPAAGEAEERFRGAGPRQRDGDAPAPGAYT